MSVPAGARLGRTYVIDPEDGVAMNLRYFAARAAGPRRMRGESPSSTGERTLVAYLVQSIVDSFACAFRED